MNELKLYEKIPPNISPIMLNHYHGPTSDFALHWHEQTEILYICEGCMSVRCGDGIMHACAGECIIINENELHEGLEGESKFICIQIQPEFFGDRHYIFKRLINDEYVANIITLALEEQREDKHPNTLAIKGYAYLLISHMVKNHAQTEVTYARYRQRVEKTDKINDAIKYIDEHLFENISTEYLAGISHLSEGYFCHLFKSVMGKSTKEYILGRRAEKAVGLIKSTNMSMLEIANQCGFSDANYFSRIFKKYMGTSPSHYRKQ